MNGKTLGRTKPAPDRSVVEETLRAAEELHADVAAGRELLTGRERALQMDIVSLRRQLDVERARNAVLVMGGKGSAPIGDTHERLAAVEERVLATGDMTDAAKLKHLDELRADMAKHKATREAWLKEVEGETAKRVEASDKLKSQAGLIITP